MNRSIFGMAGSQVSVGNIYVLVLAGNIKFHWKSSGWKVRSCTGTYHI